MFVINSNFLFTILKIIFQFLLCEIIKHKNTKTAYRKLKPKWWLKEWMWSTMFHLPVGSGALSVVELEWLLDELEWSWYCKGGGGSLLVTDVWETAGVWWCIVAVEVPVLTMFWRLLLVLVAAAVVLTAMCGWWLLSVYVPVVTRFCRLLAATYWRLFWTVDESRRSCGGEPSDRTGLTLLSPALPDDRLLSPVDWGTVKKTEIILIRTVKLW